MRQCRYHQICGLMVEDHLIYCILHFPDQGKDQQAFAEAIATHRKDHGDRFGYIYFPNIADFKEVTFSQRADFTFAKFFQMANFNSATFSAGANFRGAEFFHNTDFRNATFSARADFSYVEFHAGTLFHYATFSQEADFTLTTFSGVTASEKASQIPSETITTGRSVTVFI